MNLSQMTVRTLLTVGFGLMAALILLVGGLAIYDMAQQKDQFHDFVKGINARAHEAQQVRTAVNARAVAARNMVLATQDSERDAEKQRVATAHTQVQQHLTRLKEMVAAPGIPANVRALVDAVHEAC